MLAAMTFRASKDVGQEENNFEFPGRFKASEQRIPSVQSRFYPHSDDRHATTAVAVSQCLILLSIYYWLIVNFILQC